MDETLRYVLMSPQFCDRGGRGGWGWMRSCCGAMLCSCRSFEKKAQKEKRAAGVGMEQYSVCVNGPRMINCVRDWDENKEVMFRQQKLGIESNGIVYPPPLQAHLLIFLRLRCFFFFFFAAFKKLT